jgi:excisionase family DNA binding protein
MGRSPSSLSSNNALQDAAAKAEGITARTSAGGRFFTYRRPPDGSHRQREASALPIDQKKQQHQRRKPMTDPPPKPIPYLTIPELAQHLKVSERTIFNLLTEGMPSVRIRRARRFLAAEVDRWFRERPKEKRTPSGSSPTSSKPLKVKGKTGRRNSRRSPSSVPQVDRSSMIDQH